MYLPPTPALLVHFHSDYIVRMNFKTFLIIELFCTNSLVAGVVFSPMENDNSDFDRSTKWIILVFIQIALFYFPIIFALPGISIVSRMPK